MNRMKAYIDTAAPKTAAIIGTGFIGLEVCENLKRLGMDVTLIEKLSQVTPGLDSDMAVYVQAHIEKSVTGGRLSFRGVLGTGIFKIFDMTVAQTGLSEREAKELGYDVAVCHNIKPNKPEYMSGKEMVIKGIADMSSGRLLGVQIVGSEGVDKRLDVFVAAITFKANVEDLFHLDLGYAPPFSTTKDPVLYTGMILDNAIHNGRPLMSAQALDELMASGEKYNLIDTRVVAQYEKNHIDTAKSIPHEKLREAAESLDKDAVTITYCNKGTTDNAAQNILLGKGFKRVFNLSGGQKHYEATHIE
jgi:rhodanese-related sulfurtransferase